MSSIVQPGDWLESGRFHGEWQGAAFGSKSCVIVNEIDVVGAGPKLHKHPYPEIFVIRRGRAMFTIGERTIEATAGQLLVVPAGVPHKFENLGPDTLETVDIHENGRFITDWLE